MSDVASKIADELRWLKDHPEFEERPATLREFLGPDYLNIDSMVRESIKDVLADIMGAEVSAERPTKFPLAMFTGAIGIGKTTVASIVLPYLCHWVLCLKDPQGFFDLLPGSRIAFMQMSTSEPQAREVVFGDIKARIQHSPWFVNKYPYDSKYKNQIRFPKDIWILPGDSAETTFEGYNILGGILDEADSHKVTKVKDYAQAGFDTIHARITSRFEDKGFLLVVGQMKKSVGFAANKLKEFKKRDDAYVAQLTIWESLGWNHYRDEATGEVPTFFYDVRRKMIIPDAIATSMTKDKERVIEIPVVFRRDFENNPEKALRDLAGIPPLVGDAFISLVDKIEDARNRWVERHFGMLEPGEKLESLSPLSPDGRIAHWFEAKNSLKRVGHLDIAYSGEGDALGFAMGHVRESVEIEGERKPYIVIDFLMRIKAVSGSEILLGDVRRRIYYLKEKLGFRIDKITMDGFESTDTKQQFRRKKIKSDIVSIDRDILPYHDLREALYEDRIEFPPYMVKMEHGSTELVEVLVKELQELVDEGDKIDHPAGGSKDVADAVAGVCTTLMGSRMYHKNVTRMDAYRGDRRATGTDASSPYSHPAFTGVEMTSTPVPPPMPRY